MLCLFQLSESMRSLDRGWGFAPARHVSVVRKTMHHPLSFSWWRPGLWPPACCQGWTPATCTARRCFCVRYSRSTAVGGRTVWSLPIGRCPPNAPSREAGRTGRRSSQRQHASANGWLGGLQGGLPFLRHRRGDVRIVVRRSLAANACQRLGTLLGAGRHDRTGLWNSPPGGRAGADRRWRWTRILPAFVVVGSRRQRGSHRHGGPENLSSPTAARRRIASRPHAARTGIAHLGRGHRWRGPAPRGCAGDTHLRPWRGQLRSVLQVAAATNRLGRPGRSIASGRRDAHGPGDAVERLPGPAAGGRHVRLARPRKKGDVPGWHTWRCASVGWS